MISLDQFYDPDQLTPQHVEFVFIDRDDTARQFTSKPVTPVKDATDPLHAVVEEAYRTAPGMAIVEAQRANSGIETICEIKRTLPGVYFLTVYDKGRHVRLVKGYSLRAVARLVAVARSV